MKKVFAVLAISTLVAFSSCKKSEDAANEVKDSTATNVTAPEVKDSVAAPVAGDSVVAPADSAK